MKKLNIYQKILSVIAGATAALNPTSGKAHMTTDLTDHAAPDNLSTPKTTIQNPN